MEEDAGEPTRRRAGTTGRAAARIDVLGGSGGAGSTTSITGVIRTFRVGSAAVTAAPDWRLVSRSQRIPAVTREPCKIKENPRERREIFTCRAPSRRRVRRGLTHVSRTVDGV